MIDVSPHLGLVYRIAQQSYPLGETEGDDVIGTGALALVQAAHRYDSSTGVPFVAFASLRIRWAIQDYLRSVAGYSRRHARGVPDLLAAGDEGAALARVDAARLLGLLSGRERWIVEQHYLEGRGLKEIAADLQVTESRICQIKQGAIRRLRFAARRVGSGST